MKIASEMILHSLVIPIRLHSGAEPEGDEDVAPVFTTEQMECDLPETKAVLESVEVPETPLECEDEPASADYSGLKVEDLAPGQAFTKPRRVVEDALESDEPRPAAPPSALPLGGIERATNEAMPAESETIEQMDLVERSQVMRAFEGKVWADAPILAKSDGIRPDHTPTIKFDTTAGSAAITPTAPMVARSKDPTSEPDMLPSIGISSRPPDKNWTIPMSVHLNNMQLTKAPSEGIDRMPVSGLSPVETGLSGTSSSTHRLEMAAPAPVTSHSTPVAREIAIQIVDQIKPFKSGGMELQLSPRELGTVSIRLVPSDAGVVISISAERIETAELIRRHSDVLLNEFRHSGYSGETSLSFSGRETSQNE